MVRQLQGETSLEYKRHLTEIKVCSYKKYDGGLVIVT